MEMEGDTAVDSIKIKTMSIKIKAQSIFVHSQQQLEVTVTPF